jgi:hypothetical protein
MSESGLTYAAVALDARLKRFTARVARATKGSKLKVVHDHPMSTAPVCRIITKQHELGDEAESMSWPNPGKLPAIKTIILSKDMAAEREAMRWASQ